MIGNIIKPELIDLIKQRGFAKLRDVLVEFEPVELAEILADFDPSEQAVFLRLLPTERAADVFEFLEIDVQEKLVEALSSEELAGLINEMDPDDRTAILEDLPENVSTRLLNLLNPDERRMADELLNYPEGSIGRLMVPQFVEINENWNVEQVLSHLRECGAEKESVHQLYVTDENWYYIYSQAMGAVQIEIAEAKSKDLSYCREEFNDLDQMKLKFKMIEEILNDMRIGSIGKLRE